jgi:hypothetical protein
MRYRKLSPTGDMVFGQNLNSFFINVPEAVAQAAKTRLNMYVGDWYLNILDGTPWNTKVLGKYTGSTRDPAVRARILETQGLLSITNYGSTFNDITRKYSVNASISTIYGTATLASPV